MLKFSAGTFFQIHLDIPFANSHPPSKFLDPPLFVTLNCVINLGLQLSDGISTEHTMTVNRFSHANNKSQLKYLTDAIVICFTFAALNILLA